MSNLIRKERQLFYTRAKYSYAVVEKTNFEENTKEFIFFERGQLKNKWLKKLYSPHFDITHFKSSNRFLLGDRTKNKKILLNIYFYNYLFEAEGKLLGLIATYNLDQTIQTLNDWTTETLNVDCELREKVKALLDIIENYKFNFKRIEG